MKHDQVSRLHKNFEDYVHEQDGVEFWFARDLQVLLGYSEWRNFSGVQKKSQKIVRNVKPRDFRSFC
ncbi:MAG: hypothetical protein CVV32_04145 [Methanomicrobiales archaeon HGW-Methanomicrobiales-3]|jgi:DNA-damage-inducible protein D|nr:MAG: hypothetical protein CVV32_04145 [Methanomicrobiales archaeon HGW-Methanomicrobiales-3]